MLRMFDIMAYLVDMNITGPVSVTLNDTSISVGGSLSLTNMSAINVNKGTLSVQGTSIPSTLIYI